MARTFKEFEAELNAIEVEETNIIEALSNIFDGYDEEIEEEGVADKIKAVVGEFEMVDSYGGEGEGETWYQVVHLKNDDIYVKLDASYQSYDGVDFDSAEILEVKPKQQTKTVYEEA